MRRAPLTVLLATLSLVPFAGLAQQGGGGGGGEQPPTPVVVERVALGDVTPRFEYIGRVEAVEQVDLRARVEGFLEERSFTEGMAVEKDQLLFTIDAAPYEAVVAQREAELAGAEATLKNAQSTVNRQRDLVARNVAAQATLDEAEAGIGSAAAQVKLAEAALRSARLQVEYTSISSPIDGFIGAAAYDVGNLVSPSSDVLATVTSADPVYVRFGVSETLLLNARRRGIDLDNPSVTPALRLSDGTTYEGEGTIVFLAPTVDRQTDSIQVRAEFGNPDRILWPGQFVTVIVSPKETESALLVQQTAVLQDRKGYYVIAVDAEDMAQKREIVVDGRFDGRWRVLQGLSEGDRVIVQGIQKVTIGTKVNPVESLQAAEGGAEGGQ